MSFTKSPRILVAPLDWGLGHAARCIPVIKELIQQEAEVIVYGSAHVLNFLKKHFPNLEQIQSNEQEIHYAKHLPAWFKILLQVNKINKNIKLEYTNLQSLIKTRQIDGVISDNRYGLNSKLIPCVFITHQLNPRVPQNLGFLRKSIQHKITSWTSNFEEIWIPDLQGSHSLSQDLSFSESKNPQQKHIGILSRFRSNQIVHNKPNGYLAIISGPEPQCTLFFQELLRIRNSLSLGMTFIIDKISNKVSSDEMDNVRILVQPNDDEFLQEIAIAKHIVCRSGYSSLMDFIRLKRTSLFIPTPGQTEQEYLAVESKKWGFGYRKQNSLKAIKSIEDWESCFKSNEQLNDTFPEEENQSHILLKNAIRDFLNTINRIE
jgi:uncharacterized protein (TIGR00661 family)